MTMCCVYVYSHVRKYKNCTHIHTYIHTYIHTNADLPEAPPTVILEMEADLELLGEEGVARLLAQVFGTHPDRFSVEFAQE
jgi:hypothetical protein